MLLFLSMKCHVRQLQMAKSIQESLGSLLSLPVLLQRTASSAVFQPGWEQTGTLQPAWLGGLGAMRGRVLEPRGGGA